MEGNKLSRKLAVLLHADVVGSTHLVQQNETLAHEQIQAAFRDLSQSIERYNGHTRELRGDALLAEFERASDAVSAAIAFQQANEAANAEAANGPKPRLRIGISLGEVVVADNTITGPGVVLAQRIEQLSEPGGVCITAALCEALPKHLPFEIESLGEQQLKGFDDALQVYRVRLSAGGSVPSPDQTVRKKSSSGNRVLRSAALIAVLIAVPLLVMLQRWDFSPGTADGEPASIAVLPFTDLQHPAQDYFGHGVADDIIADLSRLKRLTVISSNSSATHSPESATIPEIAAALGVQYLVTGSVRRASDQIRVNTRLLEGATGKLLWGHHFDGKPDELFTFEDEITRRVVGELAIQLTGEEQEKITRGGPASFEAYDLFLRGTKYWTDFSAEGFTRAIEMYEQAISVDPAFGRAYGAIAVAMMRQVLAGYATAPAETRERALAMAKKAVALSPDSPQTHWALGYIQMYLNRFDDAVASLERAIELSPSYADAYALLALIRNNQGLAEDAIRLLEIGMVLNPHYSWDYLYNLGRAHYALGQHEKAAEYLEQALARNESPGHPRLFLIASYVELGRLDDAEWEVEQLGLFHPEITLDVIRKTVPISDEALMNRLLADLGDAGLAE